MGYSSYGRAGDNDEDFDDHAAHRTAGSSRGAIIVMVLVGLGIIAVLLYTYVRKRTDYSSWDVTATVSNIDNAGQLRTTEGYILYNQDGAEGHNGQGRTIWKISYNLSSPIAAACGECAAFADRGGQTLNVTDGSGANYYISVPEKIVQICISRQGVTAVRTDAESADHIYLYSMTGELLLDIKTEVRTSGFPVTMALSPDGTKLVTSYIKIENEQQNWITFYNFGEVGQNYADRIVGSYLWEDGLTPDIRFTDDDRVIITSTSGCTMYKFLEIPEKYTKFDTDGDIVSITGGTSGFVLASKNAEGIYTIYRYDASGEKQSEFTTGVDFNRMELTGEEVILLYDDSCVIYNRNGKEKFRARFDEVIRTMFANNKTTGYTVVGNSETKTISLKTKSE